MSSLVSEFLLNPVLRQARRFSSGPQTPEPSLIPSEPSLSQPSSTQGGCTGVDQASTAERHDGTLGRGRNGPGAGSRQAGLDSSGNSGVQGSLPDAGTRQAMNTNQQSVPATEPVPGTATQLRTVASPAATMASTINGRTVLPENDGMGLLRQRILAIQSRGDIEQEDKARLMHSLLMENYNRTRGAAQTYDRPVSPSSLAIPEQARARGALESALSFLNNRGGEDPSVARIKLTPEDLRPTFAPASKPEATNTAIYHTNVGDEVDHLDTRDKLGCEHYRRNVKMQCATCERWYTCRLCHDKVEDHILPRRDTKHMLCMLCGCAQKASGACRNCGVMAGRYYCDVCKLWNDDPAKPIYHCDKCGICRVGNGVGRDFFHCDKCMACIAIAIQDKHKCLERSLDCDCPICSDYLFSSRKQVVFMRCGHSIHKECYDALLKTSYKCPLCSKSVVNMDIQFRHYDNAIATQPMPPEYNDTRAIVTCNDCSAKSQTAFHWLGLKCSVCRSYNTALVQILNPPTNAVLNPPHNGTGLEAALLSSGGVGAILASLPQDTAAAAAAATGPPEQLSQMTISPPTLAPIDIPRGSGTTRPGTSAGEDLDPAAFSPYVLPNRVARSVSPIPVIGGPEADDEREVRDFWGGDANGNILTSGGESDDEGEGTDDSSTDEDENLDVDDEEEEDDDNDILLFGHR